LLFRASSCHLPADDSHRADHVEASMLDNGYEGDAWRSHSSPLTPTEITPC
jgi:hypothetical protein